MAARADTTLDVRSEPYPIPPISGLFAASIQAVCFWCLGMVLLFPGALPESLAQNRFGTVVGVWFISTLVVGNIVRTNAFEIWKGKQLLWSSLQAQRLPNISDLVQAFQSAGVELHLPPT